MASSPALSADHLRWNERTAVFVATRMLMVERKSPERVEQFFHNILPVLDSEEPVVVGSR